MNWSLIRYRKELNITQAEMAIDIDISLTSYAKKEKGKTDFKQSEMENIIKVFSDNHLILTVDEVFFYKM